jgi:hypothetical protein
LFFAVQGCFRFEGDRFGLEGGLRPGFLLEFEFGVLSYELREQFLLFGAQIPF